MVSRSLPWKASDYQLKAWSSDNSASAAALRIKGFAELPSGDLGDVRWRITCKEIRGYLIKDGTNVASFSGVIAEGGAEGVVTSSSGDSGSWMWDGPVDGDLQLLSTPRVLNYSPLSVRYA